MNRSGEEQFWCGKGGWVYLKRVSAATLLVGALLLAGCGDSTSTTSSRALAPRSASTVTHAEQDAASVLDSPGAVRAFARYVVCMHEHGVRHVPARRSPVRLLNALYARSATYRAANLALLHDAGGQPGRRRPDARSGLGVDLWGHMRAYRRIDCGPAFARRGA
jgi:hypothetical protein